MIRNYFLVAVRRLSREKAYVAVNILTLALGVGSFLLLALYLRSELTYDRGHVNHERIYRIVTTFKGTGGETRSAQSQEGLGPLLVKDYPQLGKQVRFIRPPEGTILRYENNQRPWNNMYLADASVFEIFSHRVLYGDSKTAFSKPFSVAISESVASYYFGDENPVGKTMIAASIPFTVTLVFADLPQNTHLKYDALFPIELMDLILPGFSKTYTSRLWSTGLYTYLMVPPEFDPASFEPIMQGFVRKYMSDSSRVATNMTFQARLQPLADIHYGEKLQGDLLTGNVSYIYGFAAIAVFVLLAACINYMNLATARAARRSKEVGMRKVLGASRAELIGRFFTESLLLTSIALVLGILVVYGALSLTPIGSLMGNPDLLQASADPQVWAGVVVLGLVVAILSGLYPTMHLSSISPLSALTQERRSWRTGFGLRQGLVAVQLCISIGVIACTLLMFNQIRYIHDKPLGFDKENRLIVTLYGYDAIKHLATIKNELRRVSHVQNTSTISVVPGTGNFSNQMVVENAQGTMDRVTLDGITVDVNFIDNMNLQIVEGRGFSEDLPTDVLESVVVNETLVRKLGWDKPLGKRLKPFPGRDPMRVIGVVKDFHYASLHNAVGPLALIPIIPAYDKAEGLQRAIMQASVIVSMTGEDLRQTLENIRKVFARFDPTFRFEPVFLDDRLNQLYRTESNLMALTGIFAGVCIFLSIIGIAALSAFLTEQRSKEIGVRKVLGATDGHILSLLGRPLAIVVVVAAIPASIAAYFAIERWLARFEYHTKISGDAFLLATVVILIVTLVTVWLQSSRALRTNPADVLRQD